MSAPALFLTVFLACTVEAVETPTIVPAAGTSRHRRSALQGRAAAPLVLAAVAAVFGRAVAAIPADVLRLLVGAAAPSAATGTSRWLSPN